ncbi:hypothetical protein GL279_01465 [Paracoccus limosus]|uniref:Uncharacterized protein n=1 Tax=Paracoccus limosus TaxID=913252 RepID=A0A844H1C9_9RHOB|nr:hypothetical protein [Paracoccus limosus]MTH33260.1 hypothetical protein [Paracoccus limosus]
MRILISAPDSPAQTGTGMAGGRGVWRAVSVPVIQPSSAVAARPLPVRG